MNGVITHVVLPEHCPHDEGHLLVFLVAATCTAACTVVPCGVSIGAGTVGVGGNGAVRIGGYDSVGSFVGISADGGIDVRAVR